MEIFAARRAELLRRIEQGVVIIASAPVALRNNDVEHAFRQSSDLYYLTGFEEPESVLLLTTHHAEHRSVLFVRPRNKEREIWDGHRAGVEGAVQTFGVDAAFPIAELDKQLPHYLGDVQRMVYRLGDNARVDESVLGCIALLRRGARRGITAPSQIVDPSEHLHEMRLRKDDADLAGMRRAIAISAEAHCEAMRLAAPGMFEYEVEAALLHTFRKHGSQRPAYSSIVGSGDNATILHYVDNNRQMQDGDLLLIDAGCEYGYYASDITRTFPVNGRFGPAQRMLYDVVLAAQLDAIAAVKPGATLGEVHNVALKTLTAGLVEHGLLQGDVDELVEKKAYSPYYMHRTSHWLGMDVHDVGAYYHKGKHRPLEAGFVLTVEPGLYVAADADCDPKWRGIGIRIEDDVLVTVGGNEVLSAAVPKTIQDVEAACAA